MTQSIEPWKLTAYALGELDADETERVRHAIETDAVLKSQLQGMQEVITRVQSAIKHSSTTVDGLTENQTATIAEHIQNATSQPVELVSNPDASSPNHLQPTKNSKPFSRYAMGGIAALAAGLLIAIVWLPPRLNKSKLAADVRAVDALKLGNSQNDLDMDGVSELSRIDPSMSSVTSDGSNSGVVPQLAQRINPSGTSEIRVKESEDYSLSYNIQSSPLSVANEERREQEIVALMEQREIAEATKPTSDIAFKNGSFSASAPPINSPTGSLPPQTSAPPRNTVLAEQLLEEMPISEAKKQSEAEIFSSAAIADPVPLATPGFGLKQEGDRYEPIVEAPFVTTEQAPLSTFSIDVDTASYSKIRQYLMQANQLPQPYAVRIEELVNYFEYDYDGPTGEHPFASNMAVHTCPWNEDHKLVRIGLQAKQMDVKDRAKANLVFLLDVSGSMDEPNKLPLVKQAISMLVRQLGENDRIAMVVYAGAAGCVLPSITGDRQAQILAALEELNAGGSTNGGQGIELAYSIARKHFIPGGINRVILCTDGDFNVGVTSNDALVKLVQEQAKSKVFLTCLGFGIGNYNDSMMEMISNQGNGVYGMVDNALEARRLMIEQLAGTLITVAKDVKIQVEFNPEKIASYRLIGYENRRLANRDFNDDKKDAGEIGAGHRVTALYEIAPVGVDSKEPQVDELRYRAKKKMEPRTKVEPSDSSSDSTVSTNEWLTLKLRYKQPEGDVSSKIEFFLTDEAAKSAADDFDFRWSSAVAEFGLLLRRSQFAPQADWGRMLERARSATGNDSYRLECLEMMTKAKSLSGR